MLSSVEQFSVIHQERASHILQVNADSDLFLALCLAGVGVQHRDNGGPCFDATHFSFFQYISSIFELLLLPWSFGVSVYE